MDPSTKPKKKSRAYQDSNTWCKVQYPTYWTMTTNCSTLELLILLIATKLFRFFKKYLQIFNGLSYNINYLMKTHLGRGFRF